MSFSGMRKVTWWNRKRVECNIRYKDLVSAFDDVGSSSWGGYFSGQVMPSDGVIEKLCNFFDVDFDEGKAHFAEDHKEWVSEHHTAKQVAKSGAMEIEKKDAFFVRQRNTKPQEVEVEFTVVRTNTTSEQEATLFSMLYGKVSYEVFSAFHDAIKRGAGDPMELIYGAVSYDEYRQIEGVLNNELSGAEAVSEQDNAGKH